MLEQDILRFEVAVDDAMLVEEDEALEDLDADLADEVQGQPVELVHLQQFVEVYVQQLEHQARVPAEEEAVFELHDVRAELGVVHDHAFQDLDLDLGLLVEFGLVADDLQRHHLLLLVVVRFEDLSERPVPQRVYYFVAVGH